jgi:hypothetical protein
VKVKPTKITKPTASKPSKHQQEQSISTPYQRLRERLAAGQQSLPRKVTRVEGEQLTCDQTWSFACTEQLFHFIEYRPSINTAESEWRCGAGHHAYEVVVGIEPHVQPVSTS